MNCSIVHAGRKRVRLRVPALRRRSEMPDLLAAYLSDQPGIEESQINRNCASITLCYDPIQWTAGTLCERIRALTPEELASIPRNGGARPVSGKAETTSGFELVLSSTGVLLGVLGESWLGPLVPFLLLGSAVPMLTRAFQAFGRDDALTVDTLDASATALLALQGEVPMAMAMVWLVNVGDWMATRRTYAPTS